MKLPLTFLATLMLAMFAIVSTAFALDPGPDGYYHTGSGIRVKTIAFIDVKVYAIGHAMKQLPPQKSKQAVIDIDTDKKIAFTMLRDVDNEKIVKALREGFQMNGYTDQAKINQFVAAFSSELKEKNTVTITYNSTAKTTTVTVQGGGTATVSGFDFMKGVWSIWFGKIDQPSLGDAMISKI